MLGPRMTIRTLDDDRQVLIDSSWVSPVQHCELNKWLPSPSEFELKDKSCFSFINFDEGMSAFCCSTFTAGRRIGTPDQVLCHVLPFKRSLLSDYYGNPALLAYYCLSSGLLANDGKGQLPEGVIFEPQRWLAEFDISQLQEIGRAIGVHGRAIIFYPENPVKILAAVYSVLEENSRGASFSFGARLTERLPFRVQVCHQPDQNSNAFLAQNAIRHFEARSAVELS